MSLTAQNIVDRVSTDMRKLVASTGADANILLEYVDRIHKDALHASIYSHLNRATVTLATVGGQTVYAIGSTPRRVLSVINRTANKPLTPLHEPHPSGEPSGGPVPSSPYQATPDNLDAQKRQGFRMAMAYGAPEYYMLIGSDIHLLPVPQTTVYSIQVFYENQVSNLSGLGATLTIPEDGLDMLVAGVNYLTAQYLKRDAEAQTWYALYDKLKKGEVVL